MWNFPLILRILSKKDKWELTDLEFWILKPIEIIMYFLSISSLSYDTQNSQKTASPRENQRHTAIFSVQHNIAARGYCSPCISVRAKNYVRKLRALIFFRIACCREGKGKFRILYSDFFFRVWREIVCRAR